MPHQVYEPFSPPILHVAPILAFCPLPAREAQQLHAPKGHASVLPPLWRRYQSFCVYLI